MLKKEDFTTIDVPADGNCLIHSILRASYKDYINNEDDNYRRTLSAHFRKLMSSSILEPDEDYKTKDSVATFVMDIFEITKPRKFMEFLEGMYNYTNRELTYPREPDDKISLEEYMNIIKSEDSIYFDTARELYDHLEKILNKKIIEFRHMLEEKMGNKLYLPTTFNKGVIEAILEDKEAPDGLYSTLPFNCKIFTYSKGANLIKFAYEYSKLEDVLYLRNVSLFFNSRLFIGDENVLSYIPDIMHINLIIVDIEENNVINIYETNKSDMYVIVHSIRNIHFEPVEVKFKAKKFTLFERDDEFIQNIISSKKLY